MNTWECKKPGVVSKVSASVFWKRTEISNGISFTITQHSNHHADRLLRAVPFVKRVVELKQPICNLMKIFVAALKCTACGSTWCFLDICVCLRGRPGIRLHSRERRECLQIGGLVEVSVSCKPVRIPWQLHTFSRFSPSVCCDNIKSGWEKARCLLWVFSYWGNTYVMPVFTYSTATSISPQSFCVANFSTRLANFTALLK